MADSVYCTVKPTQPCKTALLQDKLKKLKYKEANGDEKTQLYPILYELYERNKNVSEIQPIFTEC